MKWSLQVGRIFGIPVRVHVTFMLLLLAVAFLGKYRGMPPQAQWYSVGMISAAFVCVLLHELSHSLMARRFGVKVDSITLLPIGGVAQMRMTPSDPRQEIVVALAGPVASLVLAAVFLVSHILTSDGPLTIRFGEAGLFKNGVLLNLFLTNLMLAVFNLIPAFPLDGGRVLRGVLSQSIGRERGTLSAAAVGQFLAIVLFFVGVFVHWGLALIAMFVYIGAEGEREELQLLVDLSNAAVADAMLRSPKSFSPETTIEEAVDTYLHGSQEDFLIVDAGDITGVVSGKELCAARNRPANTPISNIMGTNVPVCDATDNLEDVYEALQQASAEVIAVTANNKLAGSIDIDQINKFDSLRPKTARR